MQDKQPKTQLTNKRTVIINFIARTSVEVSVPSHYPENYENLTIEQVDNLADRAFGKVHGETADWQIDEEEWLSEA